MLRGNLANVQKKGCFFLGFLLLMGIPYVIYLGIIVFCVPTLFKHCRHWKRCLQVEQCQQFMRRCSLHPCFCKRLPSHTGQEQACTRITRLFVCLFVRYHAENGPIHRKMVVACPLVITSKVKFFFRPNKTRKGEWMVQPVFCIVDTGSCLMGLSLECDVLIENFNISFIGSLGAFLHTPKYFSFYYWHQLHDLAKCALFLVLCARYLVLSAAP